MARGGVIAPADGGLIFQVNSRSPYFPYPSFAGKSAPYLGTWAVVADIVWFSFSPDSL
jgi:hypothetical protein